jgi:hypothetical protein
MASLIFYRSTINFVSLRTSKALPKKLFFIFIAIHKKIIKIYILGQPFGVAIA